ncbi:MAG: 50S ribosomal protein L21 [Nitrospirota bacterium]
MYAIIEKGGKQYRVSPGGKIKVEKIPFETGAEVVLDKVLMVSKDGGNIFGSPYIRGAKVIALVEDKGKARKVVVFKKKPRKNYRRLRGHRQPFTSLNIKEIVFGG